jgi:group I intron endonuclease
MTTTGVILYVSRNSYNGHRYIGITKNSLKHRSSRHLSNARNGHKGRFYNAIRKYGEDSFAFDVMAVLPSFEIAQEAERDAIAWISPEYNLTSGGDGALGYRHNPEAIRKMSELKKGKPGVWTGRNRSKEQIDKMRERLLLNPIKYWLGKKRSKDTIDKIRKSKEGRPSRITQSSEMARMSNISKASEDNKKSIICVNDGIVYDSLKSSADHYGLSKSNISKVCCGKRNSCGGMVFVYEVAK